MPTSQQTGLEFLNDGGLLGQAIVRHDWSTTAVGPIGTWPAYLKTATAIMLRSKVPIVMLWGEPGVMIYNDAYSVFAGARHPRLLGSDVREGWPEVADFNDHVMKVGLAGGTLSYQDQELVLHRHGRAEQVWMNLDYSPLLDEAGQPAGVMAIVVETTEKVQAQRRLSSERERLALLFEQAPGFMAMLHGPDFRFDLANPSYRRMVGNRDLIGRTVAEVLPEADRQGYVELLGKVYRSGEAYIAYAAPYAMQPEPGAPVTQRYLDFVYQPIRDETGQVTDIFVEGTDVTERVKGEAAREAAARAEQAALLALSAQDRQFRALVTASSDVVYRMDPAWQRVLSLYGGDFLESTAPERKSWLQSYVPEEDQPRVAEAIARAIRTRGTFQLEHRVLRADGSAGWTFSRAIPVFDEAGEISGWFGAASDITHRKQVEQELQDRDERLREADRRKDEFLATLAHELRNPLAPIRNAVYLLSTLGDDERLRRLRGMLERQVGHMVRLVDDLMEISRVSRGQIELRQEPVDIAEVIEAAVESARPLIDASRHRLALQLPPRPLWVQGDAVRLTQVLANLLNNAARYTPEGGAIELSLAADAGDGSIVVSVKDNGIGIAADQLPRLFEMFSQIERRISRAHGGLGIGLSLAQRLVQMHGGTLGAASAGPDRGSCFTIRLPPAPPHRAPATPPARTAAAPTALPNATPQRVLLVDDNRDAADSTAELLATLGAEVRVVYEGEAGLALVRDWHPSLVILDIGMPGMDGHEVARRLRQDGEKRLPVLAALTGWGQEEDRARTLASGFDHHLVKPVALPDLRSLMAAITEQAVAQG